MTGTTMAQETERQNQWRHNVYIELGPKFTSHYSPDLSHFRPTGGYGSYIYVDSKLRTWQASARYELVTPNQHWGLRTGLQYSLCKKQLGYDALTPDELHLMNYEPQYYLFEVNNSEQLEYLRLRGIEQISHYLSVPLELRYYFTYSDLPSFRWYFSAEADLDFLVGNANTVNFLSEEMATYAEQVYSHYDNPDSFMASAYLGAGFQVCKPNHIGVGFNWLLHLADFGGTTGMLQAKPNFAGSKLQIELVIPIK